MDNLVYNRRNFLIFNQLHWIILSLILIENNRELTAFNYVKNTQLNAVITIIKFISTYQRKQIRRYFYASYAFLNIFLWFEYFRDRVFALNDINLHFLVLLP